MEPGPLGGDWLKVKRAEKSRAYRARLAHAGIKLKPKGRPLIGTVASGWKHRLN